MSKKTDKPKCKSEALEIELGKNEKPEAKAAKAFTSPTVLAAVTIKDRYKDQELMNINHIKKAIEEHSESIKGGNMERVEDMLIAQAHTLDSLFNEMIIRSRLNMGEHLNATHKYMTLGLKAQSQCRTTLEALAEIKNPKPYIQNNRAQYQQVNNGTATHAEKNSKSTNELLEDKTDEQEWLDTGTPEKTGRNDTELEAVETQHRSKD